MDKLGITVFDVAIIAVACFGALLGASAGFAHAVLFIGSWIAAGWVAWKYAKLIQPEVEQLVGSTELAYFLAMLAVFVGRADRAGDADQRAVALGAGEPARQARPHPGRRLRRAVRLGGGRHRLPVLRLSRAARPAAGRRGRRHLPDDQGNGQFRRTLPAAGLPHPPAGPRRRYRAGSIPSPAAPAAPAAPSTDDAKPPETKPPQ